MLRLRRLCLPDDHGAQRVTHTAASTRAVIVQQPTGRVGHDQGGWGVLRQGTSRAAGTMAAA